MVSAASYAARKFGVHSAMPLRTAYKLCPQAIFVEGHPRALSRILGQASTRSCNRFSPLVEMASIDEAYLDMTGTERLLGPPLRAAHALHEAVQGETRLNCSIGIATSRLVAKIASDQAKPNGILWMLPGQEARSSRRSKSARSPASARSRRRICTQSAFAASAIWRALDENVLEARFGKWGLALAGKAQRSRRRRLVRRRDRRARRPEIHQPRAHLQRRHRRRGALEATLAQLSEKVAPPPARAPAARPHRAAQAALLGFLHHHARALRSISPTQIDIELVEAVRELFHETWTGGPIRLLGVYAQSLEDGEGQTS